MRNNLKLRQNQSGGFVELIVTVIISIVMLNLLGVDVVSFLAKPAVRDFAIYTRDIIVMVWNDIVAIVSFFIEFFRT